MKYLYETHMHTSPVSACAVSTPAEQVRAYKDRGYAGIIVTDHFVNGNSGVPRGLPWDQKMRLFASGYEKAREEGERCGLDVFLGWEYDINGTEFLTYGLSLDFLLSHPGMDRLSISRYSKLVRKDGGYLAQAHPFREGSWIWNPGPAAPRLMNGVEVFNAGMPGGVNAKAREFALAHGLAMQSGSDSHHTEIPFYSGVALGKRAESIFDIIDAIKTGGAELIVPR